VETMATVNTLAAYYGVPIVPVWEWTKSVVPSLYDLDELFLDGVHPGGAPLIAYIVEQLQALLTQLSVPSVTLPERLYSGSADYENDSTIKLGTEYDSKTGTWTETGTQVESSEVGATITYSATCQSFGRYRADGASEDVEVSIDGGAYQAMTVYQNGAEIATGRGAHTITIKVRSGTVRIEEFWAV
jgi:hypothetical protein